MSYADKGIAPMVELIVHPVDINLVGAEEPDTLGGALKKVTPSLIILGVAAGAAAALGSGAVNKYLWKK